MTLDTQRGGTAQASSTHLHLGAQDDVLRRRPSQSDAEALQCIPRPSCKACGERVRPAPRGGGREGTVPPCVASVPPHKRHSWWREHGAHRCCTGVQATAPAKHRRGVGGARGCQPWPSSGACPGLNRLGILRSRRVHGHQDILRLRALQRQAKISGTQKRMHIWHLLHRQPSHVSGCKFARQYLCANTHSPAQPSGTWGRRGTMDCSCWVSQSTALRW